MSIIKSADLSRIDERLYPIIVFFQRSVPAQVQRSGHWQIFLAAVRDTCRTGHFYRGERINFGSIRTEYSINYSSRDVLTSRKLTNYGIQITIKCFLVRDDQWNLEAGEKIAGGDCCKTVWKREGRDVREAPLLPLVAHYQQSSPEESQLTRTLVSTRTC